MPKLMTQEERASVGAKVDYTASAPQTLAPEYIDLAYRLAEIHGNVRIAKETSGIHFYMASPMCLERDGAIELRKMHLAVNIQKYIDKKRDSIALCMKTSKSYKLSELLRMPPLAERGIVAERPQVQTGPANVDYLETDARGRLVPKGPGEVVPVYDLPDDHPARVYLAERGFCPVRLWDQFRLSFGVKERSDMYYRRLAGGFRATPQGRIIFFMDMLGVQAGWQARILELEREQELYFYHPYDAAWVVVKTREDRASPWRLCANYDAWDPVKYLTGHGTRRNDTLIGFDAALAAGARDPKGRKYCFLLEGPMDAGRLGPPGIGHVGKYLSPKQAEHIANAFERVIYIRDMDASGEKATEYVANQFTPYCDRLTVDFYDPPPGVKDVGELTYEAADEFKKSIL